MLNSFRGEVPIRSESDIVLVRRTVREVATQAGFGITDVTRIITAASELARNIFLYAGCGLMRWQVIETSNSQGIEMEFVDEGPGIADIEEALRAGYSTSGGLGMGLPGARRLMDEMEIESTPGRGTRVRISKWRSK